MKNRLKIKKLQSSNSLVELNTAELRQVIGGNAALVPLLADIFSHPDTQFTFGYENGIAVFRAVLLLPGVRVEQRVDQNGATQIVYSPL